MQGLAPYIFFSGNCEEAMNYYKECLDGEITTLMRFDNSPMEVPEEHKNKVLHCEFTFDGNTFMGADPFPASNAPFGSNFQMSVGSDNLEKIEQWFNNLAKDGTITMPLQDAFWGDKFGMVTDKYGICWMLKSETQVQS